MKKIFLLLLISLIASPLFAENIKTIQLNDGSLIKGEILSLDEDVYTVETSTFGTLEIKDADIASISSISQIQQQQTTSAATTQSLPSGNQLMQQAQQLQGSMMADPEVMTEMQNLMSNPEVMEILTDESFINSLMTNPEMMLENDKLKVLMASPQIQALMQKVQQKQLMTP
ncbi:hypothetical protein ACFL49_00675 [Candidatus Omnitrophota bacterium]